MAAIDEEDIIKQGALARVEDLTKKLVPLVKELDELYAAGIKANGALKGQSATMNQMSTIANKLVEQEKQQIKAQQQIADALLKDAMAADRYNSSITKLNDSLAKNKKAYENLKNEAARNSDIGKKLNTIIESQTKALNDLRKASDSAKDSHKSFENAMGSLDNATGGLIGRVKGLGVELANLAKSPFVLIAAAIVGIFMALKSAAEAYYQANIEGEEALAASEAKTKAFFDTFKSSWLELGKVTASVWDGIKSAAMGFFGTLMFQSQDTISKMKQNEYELLLIEQERFALRNEHLRDLIDDSNTELKVSKLLEEAKDKDNNTAKERLKALLEGNDLLREQEEGDIDLAKRDLQLQKDIVQYESNVNKGKFDQTRSILELTDEEIKQIGVKFEDVKKLGELEAALIKVESDASAKRVSRLKIEISTRKEVTEEAKKEKEFRELLYQLQNKGQDVGGELDYRRNNANPQNELDRMKEFVDDSTDIQVKGAYEVMMAAKATLDAKLDYLKKYNDAVSEGIDVEKQLDQLMTIQEAYQVFAAGVNALQDTYTQNQITRINDEKAANDTAKAEELALVGDNADAKTAIEKKYAEKDKQLKKEQAQATRKAAIFDKAIALIGAAITLSELILKALLAPTPTNIAAAVAGGFQVAAIGAKQIPAYAKGTKSAKGGASLVSEEGFEFVRPRDGSSGWFTPMLPSIVDIPEGAEVVPHKETMKMFAKNSVSDRQANNSELSEIKNELAKQTKVIKDKPFINFHFTEGAIRAEIQRATRKERRLGDLYS